jgi:hypothetical protein
MGEEQVEPPPRLFGRDDEFHRFRREIFGQIHESR